MLEISKMKKILILVMMILAFNSVTLFSNDVDEDKDEDNANLKLISPIIVMKFDNKTDDKSIDFLQDIIPNTLVNSIKKKSNIQILENSKLEEIIEKQFSASSDYISDEDRIKIGKLLAARGIIFGDFINIDGKIKVTARVVDIETATIIVVESVIGNINKEIFIKLNELGENISLSLKGTSTGTLSLSTYPVTEAQVMINDEIIGLTPIVNRRFRKGSYNIKIIKDAYEPIEKQIVIIESDNTNIQINLKEKQYLNKPISIRLMGYFPAYSSKNIDLSYAFGFGAEYSFDFIALGINMTKYFIKRIDNLDTFTDYSPEIKRDMQIWNYSLKLMYFPLYHFDFKIREYLSPYILADIGLADSGLSENKAKLSYYLGVGVRVIPYSRFTFGFDVSYFYLGKYLISKPVFNPLGDTIYDETNFEIYGINMSINAGFHF